MTQSHFRAIEALDVLRVMGICVSHVPRIISQRRNTHWVVDAPDGRGVLRRYSSDRSHSDVTYELRLLEHLDKKGWPVPIPIAPVVEQVGTIWALFRYMPGRAPAPRSVAGASLEQRRRGRLLARLHRDMAALVKVGQRPGWRRADEGLVDRTGKSPADEVLRRFERECPAQGHVLRAYTDRMRERLEELLPKAPAPVVIHGDLTPWNIRYLRGDLSAILDFDNAHLDFRVADFALSWRGRYDDVVRGYEEESPLEPIEKELLVPIYWAWVIAGAVAGLDEGGGTADWAVGHLLRTELGGARMA